MKNTSKTLIKHLFNEHFQARTLAEFNSNSHQQPLVL